MQTTNTPAAHDVALIGLGAMGAALARALLANGRKIAVWNRNPARSGPLVELGATPARDVAAAVAASAVVIVCVTDYAATLELFADVDLRGRTIVQLSTGTPQEARDGAAWAAARGARYLDGAIMAVPAQIGRPESVILVSGPPAVYGEVEPLLAGTLGALAFVGEPIGAAAAFDLSLLGCLFGALLGFYHGARLIEVEGLGVDALAQMLVATLPAIGGMVQQDAHVIRTGEYSGPESSLEICWRAMELLARQARDAGIDAAFPGFAAGQFRRGVDAGHGAEAPAAMIKLLRAAGGR